MIRSILAVLALAAAFAAYGQSYPSKPVRVVVSTVPGPLDTFARMVLDKMSAVKGELRFDIVSQPTGFPDATGVTVTFGYKRYF